ncbi:serine/threonine-protein kinase [Streptomyces djakartensis]|uniref:serine/threonine-protein kinase n=1 Tax=Streptomyces djakartensis TaxID=68193 RepID=UPI0034DF4AC6
MSGTPSAPFHPLKADDPTEVGGYRPVAVLGTGGMGKVYLTYTPGGRPIALKVIRSEFGEDPEFRRRFQREVHAAQRVQGLYTAPVIDFDVSGTRPWLATAYVPGPTLAHAVGAYGALPTHSVLLLAAGVAEALHVIHKAGIVHRDLKPGNVLLAADGPRVIDFGIARAADATALTGSGVTVGTPAFMAPEQASTGTVTFATDVFALGQIMAYAAIGTPAYGDGPSHAVLYRIVHEEPNLDGLPDVLRPLVARCLDRAPDKRPGLTEIIELCHDISPQPLRQGEDWLPDRVAEAITERQRLPAPARPATPPGYTPTAHVQREPAPPAAPAYAPTQTAPGRVTEPGSGAYPPAGPGPTPQPPTTPSPGPRAAGKRTMLIAGAVAAVAVVVGLIAVLLPDDEPDGNASKPPVSSRSSKDGGSPGSNDAGGSSGQSRPDPKPAAYTGVDVPASYHIRLADDPPRPVEGSGVGAGGDLYFQPATLNVVETDEIRSGDGKLVLLGNAQKGSLDVCRSETRFTETIRLDQLGDGMQFCVLSEAGHIALATYRGLSSEEDPSRYITLDLTVWRNVENG